jgi:membrane-anchored protein YejM (alkaline phosphatase superfamily)
MKILLTTCHIFACTVLFGQVQLTNFTSGDKPQLSLAAVAQQKQKPNVLFIIADDLTATAVSSYENQACHTPNIDQLASEGTRFTRAYWK